MKMSGHDLGEKMSNLKLELNLAKLKELELTPDEYVFLYCHYHSISRDFYSCPAIDFLEQKGYIKIGDGDNVILREKAIKLFEVPDKDKMWEEFFTTFPLKVPSRNGGSRPLRAANLTTEFANKVKPKYLKIIEKSPELHSVIMDSLRAEMDMRRSSSSFQFMHAMDTWLNKREWEKYSYLIEEKKEKNEQPTGYGQNLI